VIENGNVDRESITRNDYLSGKSIKMIKSDSDVSVKKFMDPKGSFVDRASRDYIKVISILDP